MMSEETLATCLSLFKLDLGITHNLRDTLFTNLIKNSEMELTKMGVGFSSTSSTVEDMQLIVDYAAWLYRKRQEDIGLSRNLRFRINNRVIQKAGASTDAEP